VEGGEEDLNRSTRRKRREVVTAAAREHSQDVRKVEESENGGKLQLNRSTQRTEIRV
jgi:hypothetical protein